MTTPCSSCSTCPRPGRPAPRTRRSRWVTVALIAVAGLMASTDAVLAQVDPSQLPPRRSPTRTPAERLDPSATLGERVFQRTLARRWLVDFEVRVQPLRLSEQGGLSVPARTPLKFDAATVIWPVAVQTSSSTTHRADITAELLFNDRSYTTEVQFQPGYQSGLTLMRMEASDFEGREMILRVKIPIDASNTIADENLARTIPWPSNWPPDALSTFKPMQFVDFVQNETEKPEADQLYAAIVARALGGRNPRDLSPWDVAKLVTGAAVESVQPTGQPQNLNRSGSLEGFNLLGGVQALQNRRGTEHDLACVVVGALRSAGIPARLVVGLDLTDSKGALNPGFRSGRPKLKSWLEFCLVDPDNQREIWFPVDAAAIRRASSRAMDIRRTWKFFGSHEDLEYVVPISFHFHPPTTVIAHGSPAFWGWFTVPESQIAGQAVRYTVSMRPTTGSDNPGRSPRSR